VAAAFEVAIVCEKCRYIAGIANMEEKRKSKQWWLWLVVGLALLVG
jgi:hypothetical protein